MALTPEDKVWLSRLAALLLRGLSEVIVGTYKTQVSVDRAADICEFGVTGKSVYERPECKGAKRWS